MIDDLCLIDSILPDELLYSIFVHLDKRDKVSQESKVTNGGDR